MGKNHLENHCKKIPNEIRQELLRLKVSKRRAGGGKSYWADSAQGLGIFEDQYGLRFTKEMPGATKQQAVESNSGETEKDRSGLSNGDKPTEVQSANASK